MKCTSRLFCFFITPCILLLASCATTEITLVWKDKTFHETSKKMVVVGTFKSPSIRNFFEDEFVKQLQEHGIEAIASYTFVPIVDLTNKDSVNTKIKEIGVDAVLVTRLVDKKTVENYVQGRVTVVPNYSHHRRRHNFDYIYTPGYMVEEEYAYAETNIYDIRSEKLIWSALSTTKISGRDQDLIKSFVKVMVDKL